MTRSHSDQNIAPAEVDESPASGQIPQPGDDVPSSARRESGSKAIGKHGCSSIPASGPKRKRSQPAADSSSSTSWAGVQDDPLVGQVIGGRYEVLDVIGVGGFGVVYRVMHRTLGKILALKLLHRHAALEPEIVLRFQREAQSTSQIQHENVVDISDYGCDPKHGYFMVMEYLEGVSLADLLDTEAPLDSLRTLVIAKQVANALAVTHARGVVHRDLKPENIMVMRRYRRPDLVKVLDFGVAYVHSSGAGRVTGLGIMVGSPCYMSPEQVKAQQVDFRSDIYGLGIVIYEMLTGVPPFDSENFFEIVMMHVNTEPVPPRVLRPELDINPELESIVMRCLEKNPKRRFRSMYTMCEACDAAERVILASYDDANQRAHKAEPRPKRQEIRFIEPVFRDDPEPSQGSEPPPDE